ncbi:hypothetical protein [Lysobacter sp. FW306-1B-D06B]|uniref:hypothetical protein n=1 Tax=Lysobacter sp. FW306-1B-D06B TaxID=3140250 RepID=UPI0031409AC3
MSLTTIRCTKCQHRNRCQHRHKLLELLKVNRNRRSPGPEYTPKDAIYAYPELAGAYSTISAAKAFALERLPYAEQAAFAAKVTEKTVDELAKGKTIVPPKRERPPRDIGHTR